MSYVQFDGEDTRYYGSIMPFTTQHGYNAVRILSSPIPVKNAGFKFYNDRDELIQSFSGYRYHYEGNAYSVSPDEIVPAAPANAPLGISPMAALQSAVVSLAIQANETADQVETITPYTDSKPVYIDNTEVIFDCDRHGAVNAWIEVDGVQINCDYEVADGHIRLTFDPLEAVGTAYISVQ